VALIEDLAAAGHPLATLCNAPDELAEAISGLAVPAHFGHLIFSCELKYAKPDPECYGRALARMGGQGRRGHLRRRPQRERGRRAALGLQSVQFTSASSARAAIAGPLPAAG
jgi:putative hydrolase of the HAD superfamily